MVEVESNFGCDADKTNVSGVFPPIKCSPDHLNHLQISSMEKIGTHNGQFHLQDSLSVILRTNLSQIHFFCPRTKICGRGWLVQTDRQCGFYPIKGSPHFALVPPKAATAIEGLQKTRKISSFFLQKIGVNSPGTNKSDQCKIIVCYSA